MADLETARKVTGVASARPLYADWFIFSGKTRPMEKFISYGPLDLISTTGFAISRCKYQSEKLKAANTVLVDRSARRFLGMDTAATDTEINGVKVKIVGGFALGPDFVSDGTVRMSDSTLASVLHGFSRSAVGVIKVHPGEDPMVVQQALKALPRLLRCSQSRNSSNSSANFRLRYHRPDRFSRRGQSLGLLSAC